jgi:hypothetical protein
MGRNRVIYQSEALYLSKNVNSTGVGEHIQLKRVQSANYNFSIERQDVNQFGQLARIDALVLQSPTVSLDFTYYPTDGFNEKALGFYVQNTAKGDEVVGNFASGQMGNSSGQNFYIVTSAEGTDLNTQLPTQFTYVTGSATGTGYHTPLQGKDVIAIGNGFLTNYTFNAAVGNLPTVNVTIEGLNMRSSSYEYQSGVVTGFNTGVVPHLFFYGTGATSGHIDGVASPAINPVSGTEIGISGTLPYPSESTGSNIISALRPGDISMDFSSYIGEGIEASPISSLDGTSSINIQSASISIPLSRTPIERLGSRFAFARVVDFPIVATLNVSAILNEVETKSLARMLDDNDKRTITLTIKKPSGTEKALIFQFKGSQLQSESFSSSIGANKTVDLVFQTQIGGPSDTNNGIYLSGTYEDTTVAGSWGY